MMPVSGQFKCGKLSAEERLMVLFHHPAMYIGTLDIPSCARTGPCLNIKTVFPGMGIPMLEIKRSHDRLIFNMGIPILVR